MVSTAHDLHQIVTHSRALWTKYNAIAREHNQKVNWATVAKELGIHVKVREKYARMYARAEQRNFCFVTCGHYKIKDYPHVFLEPLSNERKLLDSGTEKVEYHPSGYNAVHANGGNIPYSNGTTNAVMNGEDHNQPVHAQDVTVVHQATPQPLQAGENTDVAGPATESTKEKASAVSESQTDVVVDEDEDMKTNGIGNSDKNQADAAIQPKKEDSEELSSNQNAEKDESVAEEK